MSRPGAVVKIPCYLLHPQKPNFIRIAVGLGQDDCVSACFWASSGLALLCWVGRGGGTDGLMFDPVGGPELYHSRVPGNCQARPNVHCPRAECSHGDGSRKQPIEALQLSVSVSSKTLRTESAAATWNGYMIRKLMNTSQIFSPVLWAN